jgi:cytochrome c
VRRDWPYATSLFAYIARAMPPDRTRPLTPDQTYAVTAYLLWASGIVDRHDRIDAASLSHVAMPAKAAFIDPHGSPLP